MSFQQEILAALQSGKGYPSLMEIVHDITRARKPHGKPTKVLSNCGVS